MAKTKQMLQKRDWLIILLLVAMIVTNWVWYQRLKGVDISLSNESTSWLQHQVEINKLKFCIDEAKRPCDITPPQY